MGKFMPEIPRFDHFSTVSSQFYTNTEIWHVIANLGFALSCKIL